MFRNTTKLWRVLKTLGLTSVVLLAGGSAAWIAHSAPQKSATSKAPESAKSERITRLDTERIHVPSEVVERLKLKTVSVSTGYPTPFAPFQGCLALDNNTLQRVHSRFAGEVVELGPCRNFAGISFATPRSLQVGDTVKAGQLLAVVWSKDLGEKKSELVDAVSKLKADEKVLVRLRELFDQGGTAERNVRDAERTVEADRVVIGRVERTLKSWRLTDNEVAAVRAEADKLFDSTAKTDPTEWARVEVRATRSGTILEKNIGIGDIVDTNADLFKIGDLTQLMVWAHVYEDDLPQLSALPKPLNWTVSVPARPGSAFGGTLESIGAVIDPNQHTALVSGRVENPNGELKIGQFVTVSINRPAVPGEVVVPTEAVVEDGRQSVVFVQPDPAKFEFVRKPVKVTRRTRDEIFLAPESAVRSGERVVSSGALLLREAAELLPVK